MGNASILADLETVLGQGKVSGSCARKWPKMQETINKHPITISACFLRVFQLHS
jgi:hypothetical protein